MSVVILKSPARHWLLEVEDFDAALAMGSLDPAEFKSIISAQINMGWSIAFEAFLDEDEALVFLAVGGVIPDSHPDKMPEIWFLPTIEMPKYSKSLIKALPESISCLLLLSGSDKGSTLIDASNEKFKRFAKLVKFNYSSDLVLSGRKFEEWIFEVKR